MVSAAASSLNVHTLSPSWFPEPLGIWYHSQIFLEFKTSQHLPHTTLACAELYNAARSTSAKTHSVLAARTAYWMGAIANLRFIYVNLGRFTMTSLSFAPIEHRVTAPSQHPLAAVLYSRLSEFPPLSGELTDRRVFTISLSSLDGCGRKKQPQPQLKVRTE